MSVPWLLAGVGGECLHRRKSTTSSLASPALIWRWSTPNHKSLGQLWGPRAADNHVRLTVFGTFTGNHYSYSTSCQFYLSFDVVSGTCSLVTVHQPPVLTTALGHDVVMPCQLNLSHDDKMVTPPVLYWVYLSEDTENARVWTPSEKYKERVHLLDNDLYSSNKSISLKNVQWADSGKYLCKVSVATKRDERFRRKGNETLLMVYGKYEFFCFLL